VTAAVVGVILNMALWFALHVIFKNVTTLHWGIITTSLPEVQSFQIVACLLALLAGYLLLVRHIGMIKVIVIGAMLGFAAQFILPVIASAI
jgi:chromate transporter